MPTLLFLGIAIYYLLSSYILFSKKRAYHTHYFLLVDAMFQREPLYRASFFQLSAFDFILLNFIPKFRGLNYHYWFQSTSLVIR